MHKTAESPSHRHSAVRNLVDGNLSRWTWLWLLGVFFAVIAMGVSAGFSFSWSHFGANDFVAYWSVPRSLVLGHGMFNKEWLSGIQQGLQFPGFDFGELGYSVMPLWNPPPLLLLLLPVASLNFTPAVLAWAFLGMALLGYATLQFNRSVIGTLTPPVALTAALVLVPTIIAMHEGQPTLFLVSCVIFAWRAYYYRQGVATGILLIPLMLKFHLFGAVLALFMSAMYRRRDWRAIAVFLGGVALLTAALSLLDPVWLRGFLAQGVSLAPAPSLWNFGELVFDLPRTAKILMLPLGIFIALWRYRNVDGVSARSLGEASILSVIFSPYVWNHDVMVLLPAVIIIARELWRPWWRLALFVPSLVLSTPLITAELVLQLFGPFASIAAHLILLMAPGGRVEQDARFALALALYVVFWRVAVRTQGTKRLREPEVVQQTSLTP